MMSNVKVVLDADGFLHKSEVFVNNCRVICRSIVVAPREHGFDVTLVIPNVDVVMKEKEKVDTRNDSSSI